MEDEEHRIQWILEREGWTCSPKQLMITALLRMRADHSFSLTERKSQPPIPAIGDRGGTDASQTPDHGTTLWIAPVPLSEWLSEDDNSQWLVPDCEIPNFLITRLPLRMVHRNWNESLQNLRRELLERYFLMFETGIRDTGVWIMFRRQIHGHPGGFRIIREGDLGWIGPEIEGSGHNPWELIIDRSVASPCRDRKLLDFEEELPLEGQNFDPEEEGEDEI